jgi:hypothetical protein
MELPLDFSRAGRSRDAAAREYFLHHSPAACPQAPL